MWSLYSRKTRQSKPARRVAHSRKPGLEVLEDRLAPAVLTVNSIADTAQATDAYLSLREAIALVNSATLPSGLSSQITGQISGTLHSGATDTIQFDHTTVTAPITLGGTQLELSLPTSTATLTIDGGAVDVTVDAHNASRVFQVDAGTTATLSGLTVENGTSLGDGGGILNGGTLTVSGCTLSRNSVTPTANESYYANGGGIRNDGMMTVSGCTLSHNSAYGLGSGGGIFNGGTIWVSGCTVSGNSGAGAGITNYGGTMWVGGCTLSGNSTYRAGGILNLAGQVTVSDCTLSGNSGDAIDNEFNGTTAVIGCILSGNSSDSGGAILNNGGTMTVSGCTLSGNSAQSGGSGGAINNDYGTMTVTDCTFSGNSARSGGAISIGRGTMRVIDCTLSGNSASYASAISNLDEAYGIGFGTMTVSDCTLSGNSDAVGVVISNGGNGGGTMTVSSCTIVGGGIINRGTMTVSSCTIVGGGIGNGGGTMWVSGCTISGNSAEYVGGGINNDSGMMWVNGCTISGNSGFQGGGIANGGTMWVSGCTLSGNSASNNPYNSSGGGFGGGIENDGTLTVSGCTLSGNSAEFDGGGIYNNAGTMTVISGCALSGNSASHSGGGIYNYGTLTVSGCALSENYATTSGGGIFNDTSGTLMVQNESTTAVYGVQTFDINSAVYGNQAPSGADLENLGGLSISHSAVRSLDNRNPGATTINVAATDTATVLAASSPVAGQIVFNMRILAAHAGAATPTGTVTLYDGNNNVLGTSTLAANGQASFTAPAIPANPPLIHAVYSGDGNFSGSTSPPPLGEYDLFSGFLAPLNTNLALGLNRTIPIKFQLTDDNGAYISSLSAVTSLQVLNGSGTNVLAGAGNPGLRYDATANQFVYNWQTKGLITGTYTVTLALADGKTYTKTVQLSASGNSAGVLSDTAGGASATTAGALLAGDVALYVDNSAGLLTADELARIQDAVTAIDAVVAPYGVTITETSDGAAANVVLDTGSTTPLGGYADGVLGCYTAAGEITLIQGWNWYAGADATAIGAGQYDFQTVVAHELGHALGLGHSADPTSTMYATLDTATARRALGVADLNIHDDDGGPDGLHAAASPVSESISAGANLFGVPAPAALGIARTRDTLGTMGGTIGQRGDASSPIPLLVGSESLRNGAGSLAETSVRTSPTILQPESRPFTLLSHEFASRTLTLVAAPVAGREQRFQALDAGPERHRGDGEKGAWSNSATSVGDHAALDALMAEWGPAEDAPAQLLDRPDPNDGLEGNRLLDSGTTAQHLAGEAFVALCGTGWLLSRTGEEKWKERRRTRMLSV